MNKTSKIVIALIAVLVIILGVVAARRAPRQSTVQTANAKEPVKIGFIGPLSGDAVNIGLNAKAAVGIAVDEVNQAGGINGRPLEVIYEDGQCSGQAASNAANKLMNVDKVSAILGGLCSSETMSFTAAANNAQQVVLSPCSSAPAITNAGDYIFRDYPSDSYAGKFAADYIYNTLGKKKTALLYVKSDWGEGIAKVFVDSYQKDGGQIVANEGYEQNSTDLRTQLTKIKAANPDMLYFVGYTEASIAGIKQAREIGLTVPMMGADAWDDATIWSKVGASGEGAMYAVIYAPMNDTFRAKMAAVVGNSEVTTCSPQAYDGLKILAQVMNQVGTDPTAIKNALYKVQYNNGVSGQSIAFDQNGDLVNASYVVKVVHNGQAVNKQ